MRFSIGLLIKLFSTAQSGNRLLSFVIGILFDLFFRYLEKFRARPSAVIPKRQALGCHPALKPQSKSTARPDTNSTVSAPPSAVEPDKIDVPTQDGPYKGDSKAFQDDLETMKRIARGE